MPFTVRFHASFILIVTQGHAPRKEGRENERERKAFRVCPDGDRTGTLSVRRTALSPLSRSGGLQASVMRRLKLSRPSLAGSSERFQVYAINPRVLRVGSFHHLCMTSHSTHLGATYPGHNASSAIVKIMRRFPKQKHHLTQCQAHAGVSSWAGVRL